MTLEDGIYSQRLRVLRATCSLPDTTVRGCIDARGHFHDNPRGSTTPIFSAIKNGSLTSTITPLLTVEA
jgi:hypothetical protein